MLAVLTSKIGLAGIAMAFVLCVVGIQEVRLKTAQHEAKTAQDGWATCRGEVATQNAAIAAQSARSTAALAEATKAQAAVIPRATHFAQKSASLAAYKPKGANQCEMLEDAVREARASFQ